MQTMLWFTLMLLVIAVMAWIALIALSVRLWFKRRRFRNEAVKFEKKIKAMEAKWKPFCW